MHAMWARHHLDMSAYILAPCARITTNHVLGFPSLEKGAQPIGCLVLYKVRGCCMVGFHILQLVLIRSMKQTCVAFSLIDL